MPDGDGRYAGLATFLDDRGDALLKTAVLLAAGREGGEDLLQEALERLLRKWQKVGADPEGYLRRIMYNRAVDGWRRKSRRPEVLGLPPEVAVADHVPGLDLRLTLIYALQQLPPRQRATVVARYWEELSEAETAAALGCSVSAVKSAASRGLRALREVMARETGSVPHLSEGNRS
ncbi:MAG TPA: SigE family RNA polymerase sigma factor [Trebonia sp.]|jgi:RNA polymerase sigma-70 factor (sigma-E family)